jgi:hypothetical protein
MEKSDFCIMYLLVFNHIRAGFKFYHVPYRINWLLRIRFWREIKVVEAGWFCVLPPDMIIVLVLYSSIKLGINCYVINVWLFCVVLSVFFQSIFVCQGWK